MFAVREHTLVVKPPTDRGVERAENRLTGMLLRGNADPHRPPAAPDAFAVFGREIGARLVKDREAHHMPMWIKVTLRRRLEQPTRGEPTPRAHWIEPEVHPSGRRNVGHH